jgi:hypothetical protein
MEANKEVSTIRYVKPTQQEAVLAAVRVLREAGVDVKVGLIYGGRPQTYACLMLMNVIVEGDRG